ncbi:hypothetical protein CH260_10105 [Rhodococcus sp. 05-2256-B2]|nr:hypothetical protein CH258_20075 [Rhodococcus sp. 05-2256-B4]OZD90485.1 hypothetical protein CH257_18470 [Rhodococcus sp. 05-2256-B3]OZD96890.1 hypothetical protein CH260_10105 [Rhodococcus sp. 05-2256-B2]OZE00487.1 hypothetical protein CH285_19720 [Rhodococcus sp. 05-2256-B1]
MILFVEKGCRNDPRSVWSSSGLGSIDSYEQEEVQTRHRSMVRRRTSLLPASVTCVSVTVPTIA